MSVQHTNSYKGYVSGCPILGNKPFGLFLTYQTANRVLLPRNVSGRPPCEPTYKSFLYVNSGMPTNQCCVLDNVFAGSFNVGS